jgi:hypothetical protein
MINVPERTRRRAAAKEAKEKKSKLIEGLAKALCLEQQIGGDKVLRMMDFFVDQLKPPEEVMEECWEQWIPKAEELIAKLELG